MEIKLIRETGANNRRSVTTSCRAGSATRSDVLRRYHGRDPREVAAWLAEDLGVEAVLRRQLQLPRQLIERGQVGDEPFPPVLPVVVSRVPAR